MTEVETYRVPVLGYPDGRVANDSTHLIEDLETRHPERLTAPDNEADAFLALLVEDFADEWLLAPFFLYRWDSEADQQHNSQWIIYEFFRGEIGHSQFEELAEMWRARQVSLLPAVSGQPSSYAMVKESLHAFLEIMEKAVRKKHFFFGSRPSSAEFAIFGMLSQLLQDLGANRFMRDQYPFTSRWIGVMDDLSGFDGNWETVSNTDNIRNGSPVYEILKLSGTYHLPMLKANQSAMDNNEKYYTLEVDGIQHKRRVLARFQPCLPALQERYRGLSAAAKAELQTPLKETGCLPFLVR